MYILKKAVIIFIIFFSFSNVYGQWNFKTVNNEFDEPFKKAFTASNNKGYLTMEFGEPLYTKESRINRPFLALNGFYFCDENADIDFNFNVNGKNSNYKLHAIKSKDSEMYYFDESIWDEEFTRDFKNAQKCSIRVVQYYCKDIYYQFNFSKSTSAYNFIVNEENPQFKEKQ
jgi:hypothetical protein